MTTQKRFRRHYALQVRERDHNPPHVHLLGRGFDVVIDLRTLQAEGEWPRGLEREVMAWVAEHRDELMQEWNQWHS